MTRTPVVVLEEVRKAYGRTAAVDGVSLSIARGSFVVLLGPSGSGKTTLLSMIGGFCLPDAGRVRINGEDVTDLGPAKRPTATVFQDYALFPHMTVGGNVGFGLEMQGIDRAERLKRGAAALDLVGLGGFADRRVHQLSGGQRQRVALARAVVVEPQVLLLDEPLGALDLNLRRQMQDELVSLQKRLGLTFVHVTHDQEEAMSIADVIVLMNAGRIEDMGAPDSVYLRPATRFAATFMGDSNVVPVRIVSVATGRAQLETPLGPIEVATERVPGWTGHASIRPEHLRPAAETDTVALGRYPVEDVTFQGAHWRCRLRLQDGTKVSMRAPADRMPGQDGIIEVHVQPGLIVLLDR